MTKSPDEAVFEVIVAAFRDKELVSENQLEGLAESISSGRLRPQDWRSLAEAQTQEGEAQEEQRGGGHATTD